MNRFDKIILSSTIFSSIIIFFMYIGLKFYNFIKTGEWLQGISTCKVFEIFCFENLFFKFISDMEALLFVALLFFVYFWFHKFLITR